MTDDAPRLPWRESAEGVVLRVRVTPRGGRDAVEGVESLSDGSPVLKVRVRAAPEDGAANAAARKVLAKALGVPAGALTLTAGAAARIKTFSVAGDPAELMQTLAETLARLSRDA
ncbi:MAG: DUF167 family protein [Microvirga sp.]|nr:DUF167 family protein [Microvirga sp.]